MKLIRKNENGFGLLIENDGYMIPEQSNVNTITESIDFSGNSPIYVNCVLQKYGVENRNGRIYPEDILKPVVEKYRELIKYNSAMNEADHPSTSVISLHNISHLIKDMWWEDNVLYGKLEIITSPGYHKMGIVSMVGDKIAEYLKRKIRLGISSRGVGSVTTKNGKTIVEDDFELVCFDLVASPSTYGAYLFNESFEINENNIYTKNNQLTKKLDSFLSNI